MVEINSFTELTNPKSKELIMPITKTIKAQVSSIKPSINHLKNLFYELK